MITTKNEFIVLGSSSGFPQADRATAGYVLKAGESLSLIDCGGGVTSSFLKRGLDPLAVKRILVSHSHPDHCCELPLFIQLIYLSGREEPLDLYLPSEFVEPFRAYMNATYLIAEKLPFEVRFVGYEDDFSFEDDISVKAVANNHLKGYADLIEKLNLPNEMQCYSLRIEVGDQTIFYSADIGTFDDIKNHLDGHSLVVLESTHVDLDQFFEFAQEISVGRYLISHLGSADEI
ncbi:MAG: ribonuclease Z, partial [candidate division Zixibacteria bacterium]|nr:ribonuclease Z [candidate division Zixibacteria bacterium]